MTLCDELYFEITLHGEKSELKKFASFLRSGDLDEFFEITPEHIIFDDNYAATDDSGKSEIIFTNDDYPIEIDEFDTDEFLDVFCQAAKNLDLYGCMFDNYDEFHFTSSKGDSYYVNSRKAMKFNDELDEVVRDEERGED